MDFREATDNLCSKINHQDLAKAMGVSVQTVRQARLSNENDAQRTPPAEWRGALIRLAEERVFYYRRLIDQLRTVKDPEAGI